MSPQLISLMVGTDHAVPVEPYGGSALVTVDQTGGTVFYADNPQVSAASNQGSIAPGANQTFTSNVWLIASSTAGVQLQIAGAASSGSTKRVTMTISADGHDSTVGLSDALLRIPFALPDSTVRWRLRVRNINYSSGGTGASGAGNSGVLSFVPVYIGAPNVTTTPWDGSFASAPVQALPAFTTPADGSEYVSGWVTNPAAQMSRDTLAAVSVGFTLSTGTTIGHSTSIPQLTWFSVTPGSTVVSAQSGTQGVPATGTLTRTSSALDFRVEYETVTTLPVGLMIGDSTTSGVVDDTTMYGGLLMPHDSWPSLAGLSRRFLWINAGVASNSLSNFANPADWRLARFDLATTVPDFAVIMSGINESHTSLSAATFSANLLTTINMLKGLGIKRIYVATSIPQPIDKVGTFTSAAIATATSIVTSTSFLNGASIDLDAGTSNSETVTASGASTGTGPFTTTVSALTKAHAIGATCWLTQETFRQSYNQVMRAVPYGVTGMFDVERGLLLPGTPAAPDITTYYGPASSFHPGAAGYARMAAQIGI